MKQNTASRKPSAKSMLRPKRPITAEYKEVFMTQGDEDRSREVSPQNQRVMAHRLSITPGSPEQSPRKTSLSGSILDPSNKGFLMDILTEQNKDEFDQLFMQGLENNQEKFLNGRQLIFVKQKKFEFTKFDPIFTLSKPVVTVKDFEIEGKKKKPKIQPLVDKPCFCCSKYLNKSVKQDICQFCALQGCKDCVYKSFPFPSKENGQQLRGRVCRVCETKFYIKQKLDEIFKAVDQKELQTEELNKDIGNLQGLHSQKRYEVDQQKLVKVNYSQEHAYRVEQFKNKVVDVNEVLLKQEKENKRIIERINAKKVDYEEKQHKIENLLKQIEQTKRNINLAQDELNAKQQDKDFIRNYLRQMNPTKKQPSQSSFKPFKKSESIVYSEGLIDQSASLVVDTNDYQTLETAMSHMKQQVMNNRSSETLNTSKAKKNSQLQQQKACCDSSCILF